MAFPRLDLWLGTPHADDLDQGTRSRDDATSRANHATSAVQADPDADLVSQIRAGNAHALATLMRTYTNALWRFAHGYVSSRAAAQEIVHDVFVALWERGADWHVTGTARAYLFAAVRNRALNVRKHDTRMQHFERTTYTWEHPPAMGEQARAADDQLLLAEQHAVLAHAVASLPFRWKQAVTLRMYEQLSYDEIAVAIGVSTGAARKLVERAQRELRVLLAPYLDQPHNETSR